MTQDEKLDAIMAQLADMNELLTEPNSGSTTGPSEIRIARMRASRQVVALMHLLAKGPGNVIEQIKALRAFNEGFHMDSGVYIGIRDAKDMVLAIHAAKKVEY